MTSRQAIEPVHSGRRWPGRWRLPPSGLPEQLPGGWAVAAAITLVLLGLRAPQTFTHPQFWAEDGAVFFSEQFVVGIRAILDPYAGYLHLVPRLTAGLASSFSAVEAPAIYAGASVIVTIWAAATVATARLPHAWVMGAMLLLPPHAGEIFGTITNAQWVMAPALAMIVATPSPNGRAARINQLAFAVASGLSGPFSIFLVPVAVWRLWRARATRRVGHWPAIHPRDRRLWRARATRRERPDLFSATLSLVVFVTALVQASFIATDPVSAIGTHDAAYVGAGILDRWIGQLALGRRTASPLDLLCDGMLVIAAACAPIYSRKTFLRLFVFAGLFMGSTWLHFLSSPLDTFDGITAGDRYFYGPRLILLWALTVVLLRGRRPAILAAVVLSGIAVHYHQWRKPPLEIMPWREAAKAIDRGYAAKIVINPPIPADGDPWTVSVPGRAP